MTQINFNKFKIHGASPLQYEFDTLIEANNYENMKISNLEFKNLKCAHRVKVFSAYIYEEKFEKIPKG